MFSDHTFVAAQPAAIADVLDRWCGASPNLGVLMLLPEAEKAQLPALQACFRERGVALVGAIFPALASERGFVTDGAWLIALDPMPRWFLIPELNAGSRTAHARISEAVAASSLPGDQPATLFLIFDAMLPNIGSILGGVYRALHDSVRYAGVNAGSETFQPMPCLFDRDSLIENGVLGLLLPAAEVIVKHEYPVAKTLMRATSTTGNRIRVIDGRPAMTVYQEVIAQDFGVQLTRENFYDYAVHYPFGVVLATDVVVRIPVGFDDEGAIHCVGEVPADSMLRLIKAPALENSACVASIAAALKAQSAAGDSLLAFYCAGRRMHLGDAAVAELQQLQSASGVRQILGALSLGEISCLEDIGMPEFHNAAIVCLKG